MLKENLRLMKNLWENLFNKIDNLHVINNNSLQNKLSEMQKITECIDFLRKGKQLNENQETALTFIKRKNMQNIYLILLKWENLIFI